MNINIYRNSGYHYYFLPIFTDKEIDEEKDIGRYLIEYYKIIDIGEDDNYDKIRNEFIGEINNNPYYSWKKSSNDNYKYIQYRLAKKMIGNITLYGIHICIDTTTGTSKDGLIKKVIKDIKKTNNIKKFESPYFGKDKSSNDFEIDLLDVFSDLKNNFFQEGNYSIRIRINTLDQSECLGVTLFVDYGNSRTTACAIDNKILQHVHQDNLGTKTRSIVLSNDLPNAKVDSLEDAKKIFEDYEVIVDSWFATTKPKLQQDIVFEYIPEEKKENSTSLLSKIKSIFSKSRSDNIINKYIMKPFLFCETAPIVFGKEAYKLTATVQPNHAFMYYFSSPKRYLWDDDKRSGVDKWYMINIDDKGESTIDEFDCYYNYFYNKVKDSENLDNISALFDRKIFKNYNSNFGEFPNRDLMIFNALKIIETAYIQINSESHRDQQSHLKRFISDIVITYPASWTKKEYDEYKLVWEQAKAIFYLSRFSKSSLEEFNVINNTTLRGRRRQSNSNTGTSTSDDYKKTFLNIRMKINESVASSIPIVLSEIKQLNDKISTWIDIYGKRNNCVRVFSLDIGGGTQDISIIDFSNNNSGQKVKLEYEVILNDSNRNSGDLLIKKLLEEILFPYFLKNVSDANIKRKFIQTLNESQGNAVAQMNRGTLTRTVYVPIVLDWLQKLNIESKELSSENLVTPINTTNVILDNLKLHNDLLNDTSFKEVIKLNKNSKIEVSRKEIERVINKWIKDLIRDPIVLYEAFECDILIVSGKPSELREVSKVIKKYFPITNNSIIFLKGYQIFPNNGATWLPFLKNNKIYDAKLSVVMGSLLINSSYRDDLLESWEGIKEKENQNIKKYYWRFGKDDTNSFIYDPYDKKSSANITFKSTDTDISIYRFLFKGSNNIQKIYQFKYIGQDNIDDEYEVTFEIDGEELKYIGLQDDNNKYKKEDFILKVNTLEDKFYWLDNPIYDIKI